MRKGDPSSNRCRNRSATNDAYKGGNITLRNRRISTPGAMRSISRPRQHIPSALESIGCDKPPSKDKINHDYQRKNASIATRKRIIGMKQSLGRLTTVQDESNKDSSFTNNVPVVSPPFFRRSPMTIKHAANNNNRNVESSKIIELPDDDDSFYVEQSKTLSDSEDSSILEVYSICSGDSNCTSSVDHALNDCHPPDKNRMLDMTQQPQQYYYSINDTARDNSRPHMAAIPIVQHNKDNIGPYNRCSETFSGTGRPSTSAAANTVIESIYSKKTSRRKEPRVISPGEIKYFHIERRGVEKQTNHVDAALRTKEAPLRNNSARGSYRSSGLDDKEIVLLDRHQSCNTSYMGHQYSHSKKNVTQKGRRHEIMTEDDRTDDITHSEAAKHKYLHQLSTTLARDETIDRSSIRTIYNENRPLSAQTMVCSSEEDESFICDTHTGNSTMMQQRYQNRGNSTPLIVVQDDQYLSRKNQTSGQERIPDNHLTHPKGIYFFSSEDDPTDSSKVAERSIHVNPNRAVTHSANGSPDELDYPTNEKKRPRINHTKLMDTVQQRKQGKKASSSKEENCMQASDQQTTNVVHGRGRFHCCNTHSSSCSTEKKTVTRRGKKSTLKQRCYPSSGKQPVRHLEDANVATIQNCGRSDLKSVYHRRLGNNDDRQQYSASPDNSAIGLTRPYGDEDYQPPPSSSIGDDDDPEKLSEDESYEPSPYERFRNEKVRRNQEYLASLGLHEIKDSLSTKKTSKGRKRKSISTSLKNTAFSQLPKGSEVGLKLSKKAASKILQVEKQNCDSLVAVGDGPCKKTIEKQETVYYAHDNKARRVATQDHMVESLSNIKEISRGIRDEQMSCFFYARSGKFDKDVGFDVSRERHIHMLSNENRNTLRGATGKLQRCMQCVACLRQDDCSQCTYCRDNIRNGGTYLRKCALRRCVAPLPPRIHNKDDDVEESLEVCKNILSTTRSSTLGEALLKADVKSLFGSNLSPYRLTSSSLTQNVDSSQKRAKPQRRQRGSGDRPQEECELSSSVNRDEDSLSDRIVLEGFDECDDSITASCNNLLDKDIDGTCRYIDRRKEAQNPSPRFFTPPNNQKVSTSGKSGAELARSLMSFQRGMLPASNDEAEAEFSEDEAFNLLVM